MAQILWMYIPEEEFIDDIIDEEAMLVPYGDFLDDITTYASPQAVRDKWAKAFPDQKPEDYAGICSALYRMANEISEDDIIVMPTLEHDGTIYIGIVIDTYSFECDEIELDDEGNSMELCIHSCELEWIAEFSEEDFTPDMLKSIQGSTALFLQRLKQDAFFRELVKKLNEEADEE